jgi:lysophospholipase L1-like esterase
LPASPVVVALGDSITAGAPGWDPDPAVRAQTGATNRESQWPYWAHRANPHLKFANHGVNRERTDEIAARLDAAVAGATAIVIQGGINDVVHERPLEETVENLHRMVLRAKEHGLAIAIAEVLPWNNGSGDAADRIRELNRSIAAIAADEGVDVLPFYATLEDPARPGLMADAWTADGNHPSVKGHRRLGELAFTTLFLEKRA